MISKARGGVSLLRKRERKEPRQDGDNYGKKTDIGGIKARYVRREERIILSLSEGYGGVQNAPSRTMGFPPL